MEYLPKPILYRTTNNTTMPNINSTWVGENGYVVKVNRIYMKRKSPIIVSYKLIEPKDNNINNEYTVSLQRFHSIFHAYNN